MCILSGRYSYERIMINHIEHLKDKGPRPTKFLRVKLFNQYRKLEGEHEPQRTGQECGYQWGSWGMGVQGLSSPKGL